MSADSYQGKRETAIAALSLFASAGTLICCALPALLVTLGMGAVMAGLAANVPALVWVSAHKKTVFIVAVVLLSVAGWMLWQARLMPCPIDPEKAAACRFLRKISVSIYILAVLLYVIGFFFAFVASKIFF